MLQQFGEALFHVEQQSLDVDATEGRQKLSDVELKTVVHLPCAREVPAFKMKQADSSVDQALEEWTFRAS